MVGITRINLQKPLAMAYRVAPSRLAE